jgi:hypothetical protein
MKITPGQRVASGPRSAYEVGERLHLTPRHAVYRTKKLLWNAHDDDPPIHEAPRDEHLHVLLRVPIVLEFLHPISDQTPQAVVPAGFQSSTDEPPPDLSLIRASLEQELELREAMRSAGCVWFLEPLDVLGLVTHTASGELAVPVVVVADPHAEPLTRAAEGAPVGKVLRACRELLLMLEIAHHLELVVGGVGPSDVLLHPSGRWWFLNTDCLTRSTDPSARAADLTSWAALCIPHVARACMPHDRLCLEPKPETDLHRFESEFWTQLTWSDPQPLADLDAHGEADCRWLIGRLKRMSNRPAAAGDLVRALRPFERQLAALRARLRRRAFSLWRRA